MKRKLLPRLISALLTIALTSSLTACSLPWTDADYENADSDEPFFGYTEQDSDPSSDDSAFGASNLTGLSRPQFFRTATGDASDIRANVPAYEVAADYSNIVNLNQFYFDDEKLSSLKENLFFVEGSFGSHEFFEEYEYNRYAQRPNFVTVDSLMHTYHLYFSYLLQSIEKKYLADNLSSLSQSMLEQSLAQYEVLKGSEWDTAAKNNLALFTVGAYLQDPSIRIPDAAADIAQEELSRIYAQSDILPSRITGTNEDYSQYIPRGYYEGDPVLEACFQAMMWYGRIAFTQENETNDRSALLMTLALRDGDFEAWEKAYTVTSFFAGASDDLGYYEYLPVIEQVFGTDARVEDLASSDTEWKKFHKLTAKLRAPQINSIPIEDQGNGKNDNVILSYRFMGQRFSIDATIMQNLVYSNVEANPDNSEDKRMLPDVLDVAATLGSETAVNLLTQQGTMNYPNYQDNLVAMQSALTNASDTLWNASLYATWLHTLTPLLEEKPEGYPSYKLTNLWNLKSLETFAGSYTELKHDTVLYSKQIMTEMGGDDDEIIDDRGYVDPEPEVYTRFANLTSATMEGLRSYGLLTSEDEENLTRLQELADQLTQISIKELQNETLTDSEYDLIRNYGGNLEHFWSDAMKGITGEESLNTQNYPAALVTDIATDPNGTVLEAATGHAQTIYVVVPVDGTLRLASGTVYSFYQFTWPSSDRLTDSKWRQMMGFQLNDYDEYDDSAAIAQPDWARLYRNYYSY